MQVSRWVFAKNLTVSFVYDAQLIITSLCETAKFLKALGYLYYTFLVHEKGQSVEH